MQHNSHLIRNVCLLDMKGRSTRRQDILVKDGRVVEIAVAGTISSTDVQTTDAEKMLAMPGLVNAHSHSHGALNKGLGDKWTLEHLLNASRWLSLGMGEEEKYLSSLLNAAELITKGCTAVYDLYGEFPTPTPEGIFAVAKGYRDAGMRVVLAPMIADKSLFEAIGGLLQGIPENLRDGLLPVRKDPGKAVMEACEGIFKSWPFDHEWVRPAIAPAIPIHCTERFLSECRRIAREFDLGIHTHLGESKAQAITGQRLYGQSITAYLDKQKLLSPRLTAAHCVWLDDDDLRRLADRGSSIAHNPTSNMRLGSGVAPVRKMLDLGIAVGLGTDGSTASDHQNMFEAMRLMSFGSRIQDTPVENWVSASEALRAGITGGTKAMRLHRHHAELQVGSNADLILLDLRNLNFVPLNDPIQQIVHNEEGSAVHSVMIGGRWAMKDRKLTHIDVDRLMSRVDQAVERIRKQSKRARTIADSIGGYISSFCNGVIREPYHISRFCGCSGEAAKFMRCD